MFYCGECATERQWPTTMFKSHGRCETCGKTAVCNDTPSSLLPAPARPGRKETDLEDKTAMEQLAQRLCDAANGSDRYQSPGFRGADADKQLAESGVKPEGFVMSPEELTARQAEKREMLQALYTPETPVDAPIVQQGRMQMGGVPGSSGLDELARRHTAKLERIEQLAEIECLRQWECPSCGTEHSMQLHSQVMGLPARMSCRSCGANYPVPPVVEEAALAKLPNAVRLSSGRIEVTKAVRESLGDDVLRKLNNSPDAEIVIIGEESEDGRVLITARQLAMGYRIHRMKAPSAIEFATFEPPLEIIYVGVGELDEGGPAVTFGVRGEMIRWAVPPETQLGVTHA